jgi:hypothetical protein
VLDVILDGGNGGEDSDRMEGYGGLRSEYRIRRPETDEARALRNLDVGDLLTHQCRGECWDAAFTLRDLPYRRRPVRAGGLRLAADEFDVIGQSEASPGVRRSR